MKLASITAAMVLGVSTATLFAAPAAHAANARNPYGNIDHSNDAGNNTGDDKIDALNASQLNQNYWSSAKTGNVPNPPMTTVTPPGGAPQPVR